MKIKMSLLFGLIFLSLFNISIKAQNTDYSHSNETDPDYAIVFPQDKVNILNISISPENWQAMADDMTNLYGEFGSFINRAGTGEDIVQPDSGENPIWVPATINFEGETWANVGIRFKGSSSLSNAWGMGNYKIPFKLDFDEFEDTFPEIENQRFYGFKELSFSSNWNDDSFLREKVTADIFREAGLVSAHTAFYAVYLDYGAGPIYFGLYTAVEVIEDTVIDTQFSDNDGNLYKPEGEGATFAAGSFSEEFFEKETNGDEADFSDILALFDALHAETRLTDPATWRTDLERVFDTDTFLLWLAVNTIVQNWDTYGLMSHNYYLYNNPDTGQLTWIPWDNNMALTDRFNYDSEGREIISLGLETVSSDWPLIRYLMDDPVYQEIYHSNLEATINGAFEPSKMSETYTYYHELIAPYVVGENGEQEGYGYLSSETAFEQALTDLIEHLNARYNEVSAYLEIANP